MSAVFTTASWPAPAAAPAWTLARNCSVTPRQMVGFYASLCAVSLAISIGFWWHGAPFVSAFAGIELAGVAAALLVWARHAGDRDVVTVEGGRVRVAHHSGARVDETTFPAAALRVRADAGAAVLLSASGRTLEVGRCVRPAARAAFARELHQALSALAAPNRFESEPKR